VWYVGKRFESLQRSVTKRGTSKPKIHLMNISYRVNLIQLSSLHAWDEQCVIHSQLYLGCDCAHYLDLNVITDYIFIFLSFINIRKCCWWHSDYKAIVEFWTSLTFSNKYAALMYCSASFLVDAGLKYIFVCGCGPEDFSVSCVTYFISHNTVYTVFTNLHVTLKVCLIFEYLLAWNPESLFSRKRGVE
jgi:hypothetical protein